MVLNMRRLVQAVFQASCKCPKGKNPHPLCVFYSILFMVPLCKAGIRCEICIGLGQDSIDLRQIIGEQLSGCVAMLTTDMLDAYADAMRDYKIPFGCSAKDYHAARRETNASMPRTFPGYDPRFRLPFLPLLTEELAMKRYRMTDSNDPKDAVQEADDNCPQMSPWSWNQSRESRTTRTFSESMNCSPRFRKTTSYETQTEKSRSSTSHLDFRSGCTGYRYQEWQPFKSLIPCDTGSGCLGLPVSNVCR